MPQKFMPLYYFCGISDEVIPDIKKRCPFTHNIGAVVYDLGTCEDCEYLSRKYKIVTDPEPEPEPAAGVPAKPKDECAYTQEEIEKESEFYCLRVDIDQRVAIDPHKLCGIDSWKNGKHDCIGCPHLITVPKKKPAKPDPMTYELDFIKRNPDCLEID
jgi:hypothetical protein